MHRDKIIARILFIFSVANLALAAPAVVRQRHLDVAKAASQKRGPPGSGNGETGDSPPESSSRMPSHDGPTDGSPAAANRITTQASGAPGLGNEETADLPPESSSRMHVLTSFSSSAPAGHITTQPSGLGNEETVDSSSSRMHGLTNGWGLSSSAPAGRITTQGAWGSDNGEAGGLTSSWSGSSPHDDPDEWSDRAWVDNAWLPASQSSSAAANHITTHRTKAPGGLTALFGGNEVTRPDHELTAPVPLHDHLTKSRLAWLLGPDSPESSSSSRPELSSSVLPHSSPTDEWPWPGHVAQVSPPLERPSAPPPDQALGATASSSSDSAQWAHSEDLPPPYQGSASKSLAAPEADRFFGDALTHSKALLYSGVAAAIGGTAALAYGIHKYIKLPYVSPLSCGHLAKSQTF
jgi:hypothetical protein